MHSENPRTSKLKNSFKASQLGDHETEHLFKVWRSGNYETELRNGTTKRNIWQGQWRQLKTWLRNSISQWRYSRAFAGPSSTTLPLVQVCLLDRFSGHVVGCLVPWEQVVTTAFLVKLWLRADVVHLASQRHVRRGLFVSPIEFLRTLQSRAWQGVGWCSTTWHRVQNHSLSQYRTAHYIKSQHMTTGHHEKFRFNTLERIHSIETCEKEGMTMKVHTCAMDWIIFYLLLCSDAIESVCKQTAHRTQGDWLVKKKTIPWK